MPFGIGKSINKNTFAPLFIFYLNFMILFEEMGLHPIMLKAIEELGFEAPTPIQEKTIPALLKDSKDILAFAQTGTGKTAAFGLPVVQLTDTSLKNTQAIKVRMKVNRILKKSFTPVT